MPGFDGTGPMGMGPMTGGGSGFCAMPSARRLPVYWRYGHRGGRGGWRAWGMPWRAPIYASAPGAYQMAPVQEVDFLKSEAEAIKEELRQIESRIEQLEKQKSES